MGYEELYYGNCETAKPQHKTSPQLLKKKSYKDIHFRYSDCATGWTRQIGVRIPVGSRLFIFYTSFRPVVGPTEFLSNGICGLFPRGQRGQGVKLTTPSSAQGNKTYFYNPPPPPQSVFMAQCLIKHKGHVRNNHVCSSESGDQ
jgi:hypothetical protein